MHIPCRGWWLLPFSLPVCTQFRNWFHPNHHWGQVIDVSTDLKVLNGEQLNNTPSEVLNEDRKDVKFKESYMEVLPEHLSIVKEEIKQPTSASIAPTKRLGAPQEINAQTVSTSSAGVQTSIDLTSMLSALQNEYTARDRQHVETSLYGDSVSMLNLVVPKSTCQQQPGCLPPQQGANNTLKPLCSSFFSLPITSLSTVESTYAVLSDTKDYSPPQQKQPQRQQQQLTTAVMPVIDQATVSKVQLLNNCIVPPANSTQEINTKPQPAKTTKKAARRKTVATRDPFCNGLGRRIDVVPIDIAAQIQQQQKIRYRQEDVATKTDKSPESTQGTKGASSVSSVGQDSIPAHRPRTQWSVNNTSVKPAKPGGMYSRASRPDGVSLLSEPDPWLLPSGDQSNGVRTVVLNEKCDTAQLPPITLDEVATYTSVVKLTPPEVDAAGVIPNPGLLKFMFQCFNDVDKELIVDVLIQCRNNAVAAMEALLPSPTDDDAGMERDGTPGAGSGDLIGQEEMATNDNSNNENVANIEDFLLDGKDSEQGDQDHLVVLCEMFPDNTVEYLEAVLKNANYVMSDAMNILLSGEVNNTEEPVEKEKKEQALSSGPSTPCKVATQPIGKKFNDVSNGIDNVDLEFLRCIFPEHLDEDLLAVLVACDFDKEKAVSYVLLMDGGDKTKRDSGGGGYQDYPNEVCVFKEMIGICVTMETRGGGIWDTSKNGGRGIATHLKCQRLQSMFSHVDPQYVAGVFAANNYNFVVTKQELFNTCPAPPAHNDAIKSVKPNSGLSLPKGTRNASPQHSTDNVSGSKAQPDLDNEFQEVVKRKRAGAKNDYSHARALPMSLIERRNDCYRKAASAFQNNSIAAAQHYSSEGHKLTQKIKDAQLDAAKRILSS
eukprot:Ihof_evm4s130 gene=Ihof_evmTU4s130